MDAKISAGSFGRCPAAGESFWGGVLPHKRLMGMCCWMGLHFLNWSEWIFGLGVSRDPKWEDSRLKKSESCCLLNLTVRLHWQYYILPLETTLIRWMHKQKVSKLGSGENHVFQKVTKMGSVIGQKIDCLTIILWAWMGCESINSPWGWRPNGLY